MGTVKSNAKRQMSPERVQRKEVEAQVVVMQDRCTLCRIRRFSNDKLINLERQKRTLNEVLVQFLHFT